MSNFNNSYYLELEGAKRMTIVPIIRLLANFAVCTTLLTTMCGCVAGQAINLQHTPSTSPVLPSSKTVSVDAKDNRDFVINGDKEPSYLGHFRASFGNTWDVNNGDDRSLAEQFQKDLTAELASRGIKTVASGERCVLVDIREWNFDAYMNGKIWYEINVSVTDANGSSLGQIVLKNKQTIKGNAMTGPKSAFKREVPIIYSGIISEIVGNNEIQKHLK